MTLKSLLKKFFLGGEVLEKFYSPINRDIDVVENLFGEREMRIGGVTQSGGLVEKLWKKILNYKFLILNQFQNSNFKCLILGLGCGTAARLISEEFPKARMVGVEIDPVVVELGKKYFGLGEVSNLEIFVADAIKFVDPKYKIHNTRLRRGFGGQAKYNLILVDLYLGQEVPKESESNDFLGSLGNMLADGGMVIFNRLYYNKEHRRKAEEFLARVKSFFPEVKTKTVVTNLLILASF